MRVLLLILLIISGNMQARTVRFQPKQMEAYRYVTQGVSPYLFYGGAKGGGKSHLIRGKEYIRRMKYAGTSGLIIRKTYKELYRNHIRKFWTEYPETLDWYRASEKAILYPNGSITEFGYLKSPDDVYNYQGIEYDDITMDEATQHPENVFKVIKTSLRQSPEIRRRHPDFRPSFLQTGNPGGIGHGWVKRMFIDRDFNPEEDPRKYGFIQAKIWDNPLFIQANPDYLQNLMDLPEELRKAYLDGDWEIFAGQYFKKLRRRKHLVDPFAIPDDWMHFRSMDWGYDHPTACIWWAVDFEGNVYIYRYYKKSGVVASATARNIVSMTPKVEDIVTTVAGHDTWARIKTEEMRTAKTMADVMANNGLFLTRANNDRVNGWNYLRELLEWDEVSDGKPKLRIFRSCEEVFKDLNRLVHDEVNTEDVKKMAGDDIGDATRYGGMHIYAGAKPVQEKTEVEQFMDHVHAKNQNRDTY